MGDMMRIPRAHRIRPSRDAGQSLLELAIALPILLGLVIGIFEFGRAWNVRQVTTNAAREGARQAVLSNTGDAEVQAVVDSYLTDAGLDPALAIVTITGASGALGTPATVQIAYPFTFVFLGPVMNLMGAGGGGAPPGSITMTTSVSMRNEG